MFPLTPNILPQSACFAQTFVHSPLFARDAFSLTQALFIQRCSAQTLFSTRGLGSSLPWAPALVWAWVWPGPGLGQVWLRLGLRPGRAQAWLGPGRPWASAQMHFFYICSLMIQSAPVDAAQNAKTYTRHFTQPHINPVQRGPTCEAHREAIFW